MASPQQYDPTSPQPYVAPDPTPPPAQSPLPQGNYFQGQPGSGNVTHGGAIAGVFDGLLRGFVNGYATGEQHKALTLKKKQDDLTASYNADAKRAYDVAQAQLAATGKIDPNSDEYKAAKSAVDGSWGALQDFRKGLLQQPGGRKKGKSNQEPEPPAMVLANPKSTPQEKAQALFEMSQKAGPPIYGQIQTMAAQAASPAFQTQFKTQQDTTSTDQSKAATNRTLFDKVNELSQLVVKENPTPEDKQHIEALKDQVAQIREALNPTKVSASGGPWFSAQDPETKRWFEFKKDAEGREVPDTRRPISVAGNKPVRAWKIGEKGKPVGIMLDPQTNQEVPGSENDTLVPPAGMLQHISNGFYMYTDNNGEVHKVPVTRTTSAVLPNATPDATPHPQNEEGHPASQPNTEHPPDRATPPKVDTHATHSDVIGHKGIPRAKIDQLDRETQTQYQKASDAFNKAVDDLNDSALKLTAQQKETAKKKLYDRLQETNRDIGAEHSQRMRDLGLIPAEDSAKQVPAATPSKPSKGTVRKAAFLAANPGATDADWNAVKTQLKDQGYNPVD